MYVICRWRSAWIYVWMMWWCWMSVCAVCATGKWRHTVIKCQVTDNPGSHGIGNFMEFPIQCSKAHLWTFPHKMFHILPDQADFLRCFSPKTDMWIMSNMENAKLHDEMKRSCLPLNEHFDITILTLTHFVLIQWNLRPFYISKSQLYHGIFK